MQIFSVKLCPLAEILQHKTHAIIGYILTYYTKSHTLFSAWARHMGSEILHTCSAQIFYFSIQFFDK